MSTSHTNSELRHDKRCPYCRRFVALENDDTYYDFADAGANSHDGSPIAPFCNEAHAKRFHNQDKLTC